MFTLPFCGFRVRAVETLPDSGTAKGCDTEEPLLLEGFPEGGTSAARMDDSLDTISQLLRRP